MNKTCETCGQAVERFRCQDCDGYGGEWTVVADDEGVWDMWLECVECDGAGTVERCTARVCESRASSPVLTAGEARFVDAALARLAAGGEGDGSDE